MLFELNGVTKKYGAVTALNNLTVQTPEGAIGLLGPNGAGKTTMIRTLLGLIKINEGNGAVLDMNIRRDQLAIRQAVGFVPEDECLFPATTGVEFVAYAGELAGMPARDALQRAHEVLDYTGLAEQRYRAVDSYSTGMKQRLKVASAIVHDPRLLILDEPTNGLDPQGRDEMLALARDLAVNKGMSLIFSSHLLPDVEAVCERIMVMGRGRLLAEGVLADLKARHEAVFQLRVKSESGAMAAHLREKGCTVTPLDDALEVHLPANASQRMLWEAADALGEQIRFLRPRRGTLEEVFLKALEE